MHNLRTLIFGCLACLLAACGGNGDDPTDVLFGETTLVIAVNPVVNDVTEEALPSPGGTQSGVELGLDEGPSATTDARGVAVLAPVPAGNRTVSAASADIDGSAAIAIADRDLHEVALAADGSAVAVMSDVRYPFGGEVVEVDPGMSVSAINDALSMSNTIVFFRGGVYEGDFSFSGSNVILFGEGPRGGRVTIQGNMTIDGSQNGIRGATVTGDLVIPGSNASVSFTRVLGNLDVAGSDAVLLLGEFCGAADVSGSGAIALGNLGLAPLAAPADCP